MKKILNKVISSGIWLQPVIMCAIIKYIKDCDSDFLDVSQNTFMIFIISWIPTLYLFMKSINAPSAKSAIQGKREAMYPAIAKENLYKKPTGIVLGKYKNKYVCKKLTEDGHIFLLGGSGSGKSSCYVIPTLLTNLNVRIFAVDIKGELSAKTAKIGDKHILIFNPADRNQFGYNPFFNLNENSTNQTILEVMQNIAYSLIPLPVDVKDPFWKMSARNLLTGLLIYHYKNDSIDFITIIDEILSKTVKESIKEVIEHAKQNSAEYRYIVQFADMEDETLGGIVAEMNNHLVVFSNDQDIRYAFKNNACKLSVKKLEDGYSIYLVIKEEKLSAYYDVMQLIINQTLAELEKRPEDADPIIFIIDELPRILSAGKLDRLLDAARTLRSRKVTLFLITQSTEALMSA